MTKKITLKNIINVIKGYSRLYRYYFTQKLMKKHKVELSFLPAYKLEQYEERLLLADKECLLSGKCKECGCSTPALYMIEDACEGGCYNDMMNAEEWQNHKNKRIK